MKLKPMADNVLLKSHETQETTASGIILATTSKEKPVVSSVVAVGPGTKDDALLNVPGHIIPTDKPQIPHPTRENTGSGEKTISK